MREREGGEKRERKSERERENLYFTPKPPEEEKNFLKEMFTNIYRLLHRFAIVPIRS